MQAMASYKQNLFLSLMVTVGCSGGLPNKAPHAASLTRILAVVFSLFIENHCIIFKYPLLLLSFCHLSPPLSLF